MGTLFFFLFSLFFFFVLFFLFFFFFFLFSFVFLFVSTPTHNQVSTDTPQHQCTQPVFLCVPAPTMILRVDDRMRGSRTEKMSASSDP